MLNVKNGENVSIKVGVLESTAKEKFTALMDLFTMYPTELQIHNNTKTCNVTVKMESNVFHLTVTNPEDEIFKL